MKKLKLFFACLLMAVLSIGQVWADTAEFSYSDLSGQGTSGSGSAFTGATKGDIAMGGVGNGNTSYTQIYGNGTLTFTPLNGATITKVVLEATSTGYVKTWSSSPSGVSVSDKYVTWEGSSTGIVTLTNTASGQARIKNMTVTYTPNTPAFTITAQSNDDSKGTVSLSGSVITGAPKAGFRYASPAYSVDPANSATVAQDGNAFTVTPSANTTVTINFEAIPTYTVQFSTGNGNPAVESKTETVGGAGITLPVGPTPTCSADGWVFAGWAEAAVALETTTAPTLLAAGANYKPATDCTLFAVYKRIEEGGGESGSVEITLNTSDFPTSYGTANTFTEYTLEGYKFKIQQIYVTGSGDSKKHQWRASGNGNGTGTIYNTQVYPAKISSIVLTYHSSDANKNHTLTVGSTENPTDGTSITGTTVGSVETFDCSTANADYFVLANGANAGYTTSIKINYGSAGTTYYLSAPTCTPPAVADPVISLASGEYEGTQNVTISCETTGAKIYYTTDESVPTSSSTLYNGPISVSASQTIKAIAIKDDVPSHIVSAEYTIVTTCETPTFSLAEGSYEGTQSVELSCTRADVEIRYTTNGDEPTASSTLYEGAITVSSTQTIKAIAIKANLENSAVASATYTITAGPDVVLDFTDNTEWQFPTEKTQGSANYTSGLYTITVFGPSANKEGYNFYTSGGSNKLLLGKEGAYIVLPEFAQPIEKIVCPGVDGASGGVKWNVFDGETAVSDEATGCTSATTFEIENPEENKSYTIKVTSSANLQIPMIKIYFGAAPAVKKPSIDGNAAFVGSQDVTITCETLGAAIYYTTDPDKKDNPDVGTWSAYSTKVTISSTCTLYAAATDGEHWSSVASKAFTATPRYASIEALQDVATSDEATVFVQMTNWLVTAITDKNVYVTDGTGKGMIFFKNGHDFAIGDKLNKVQLQTTLQNYNGTYELKNLTTADFAGEGELVHGATIPAIPKTATEYAALTNANQGVLYVVNNLVYDETNHKFMDGVNEIAYYNKFSIDESSLVNGHTYTVTGVAVYYNGGETPVVQLCPRTAADLKDNTAYVQIEFNANTTESYGGTLPTTITTHVSGTDYTVPAPCLTRTDGYYQLGWNTDKDATVALTTLTNVTANQVLYAIWKETDNCTITFYSKGVVHDTKVVAQNAAYNFSDVTAPSAQGYTFAGWSETEITTEEASANILDSYTPTSTTKNLYAVFSRKVDGETTTQYEKVTVAPASWAGNYLLVYENSATQGYVWDGTDANPNYKTATIATGVIATKPADAALLTIAAYSTGHSILINGGDNDGKYLIGNGSNTKLLFGDEADAVTISCETNGTELLFTQRSIRYMDGRFRFYSDDKDLAWLYRENTVTPQSDVYTTNPATRYTISFVLATGESGSFNDISVVEGEDATLPTEIPTKLHNTFLKWSDGESEYAAGATIENVTADIELHATWNPETPANVTFNLNGASGSIPAIENLYGGDAYVLPAAPEYDAEHSFAGWKHGDEVFAANTPMTMTTPAAAIEYVAQWNEVTIDQVVILAQYAGNWYAVKAEAGASHSIVGVQVDYRYGNIYNDFTADEKAAITWTRKTAGDKMSFKNGTKYLYGKTNDDNDLDLVDNECLWTFDGTVSPATFRTHSNHSILLRGEYGTFKNYKNVNASEDGVTGAYSALPIVTAAKFGTIYTRPEAVQGQLGTICVPNGGKMVGATPFEIAYMDYDADHNPNKIYLDEVDVMIAGRPYFFLAEDENPEVKVYYTDEENVATAGNYRGLYGTFNQIDKLEQGYYIVYNNLYYHVNSDNVKILANRAYIKLSEVPDYDGSANNPDPTKAPRRISLGNGNAVPQGIDNLETGDAPKKVMIEGTLYIFRGEKQYDATGRLVK